MLWRRSMSLSLKQRLDAVWNDPRVACPSHLVRWREEPFGYIIHRELGLYYDKGSPRHPKRKRIKTGYTWLCKGYGFYSRMAWLNLKS